MISITFEHRDDALHAIEQHIGASSPIEISIESKIYKQLGKVQHTMTITTEMDLEVTKFETCYLCAGKRTIMAGKLSCPVCTIGK